MDKTNGCRWTEEDWIKQMDADDNFLDACWDNCVEDAKYWLEQGANVIYSDDFDRDI